MSFVLLQKEGLMMHQPVLQQQITHFLLIACHEVLPLCYAGLSHG